MEQYELPGSARESSEVLADGQKQRKDRGKGLAHFPFQLRLAHTVSGLFCQDENERKGGLTLRAVAMLSSLPSAEKNLRFGTLRNAPERFGTLRTSEARKRFKAKRKRRSP